MINIRSVSQSTAHTLEQDLNDINERGGKIHSVVYDPNRMRYMIIWNN